MEENFNQSLSNRQPEQIKKSWITPELDVMRADAIRAGTTTSGPEGKLTSGGGGIYQPAS